MSSLLAPPRLRREILGRTKRNNGYAPFPRQGKLSPFRTLARDYSSTSSTRSAREGGQKRCRKREGGGSRALSPSLPLSIGHLSLVPPSLSRFFGTLSQALSPAESSHSPMQSRVGVHSSGLDSSREEKDFGEHRRETVFVPFFSFAQKADAEGARLLSLSIRKKILLRSRRRQHGVPPRDFRRPCDRSRSCRHLVGKGAAR